MESTLPVRRKPDLVVGLIALLCIPLFFYGLGDTYLWQDEAQTALLGRSVLNHTVPMVGTGSGSLSAVRGKDAGIGGIYFQIAWLQAYLAAASFTIFGESSWSARLPFALAGWLCIPLTAWAMRNAGACRRAARIGALLMALSVPFIVCSRQARYYGLTAALVLLTTGTYVALLESVAENNGRARRLSIGFAAAASLLVFSFDITAIGILGVLACHWVITTRSRPVQWDRHFWFGWGCASVILAAWLALSFSALSRTENAGLGSLPGRIRHGAFYYLGQINAHMLPLPLLLMLASVWWRRTPGSTHDDEMSGNRKAVLVLSAIALGGIGGAILSPHRFFRYAVPVFPIVVGVAAIGIAALWSGARWGKILAITTVLALISSNSLFVWSHAALASIARSSGLVTVRERPKAHEIPLALLVQEFRDPPRGPIAAMIGYLREHASEDDVLVTTYGDLPLKFHTDLEIYGGETGQLPPADMRVDWIWPRNLKVYAEVRPVAEWIQHALSEGGYQRIELPVPDRRWENREDPEEHIFTNPGPDAPPVVVYKLMRGTE